jgi:7-keto-8-aminopelargonate synthetase-like enzyme
MDNSDSYRSKYADLVEELRRQKMNGVTPDPIINSLAHQLERMCSQAADAIEELCAGPNDEAVKLLRRCHDSGDLVTPLDETLREDVAAFFRSRATPQHTKEDV